MLKAIAAITMVIDHIGKVFFPELILMQVIGRLAMPIYCYCLAEGMKHTRDVKKYMRNLLITAVIAQIPYMMLFGFRMNILFSFLLTMIFIQIIEKTKSKPCVVLYVFTLLVIAQVMNMEYGFLVPALILTFYYRDSEWMMPEAFWLLAIMLYALMRMDLYQLVALAAWPLCKLYNRRLNINKYVWYAVYPAHMVLIALVAQFI